MDAREQRAGQGLQVLLVALGLAILIGAGVCVWILPAVKVPEADPPHVTTSERAQSPDAPAVEPLLQGWDRPAVALILSGEMHGYIEPCGCTAGQIGGLARRATLVKQLREQRGWATLGLDTGGTMIAERVGRQQTNLKFDFARDALNLCGFGSLAIGYEEVLPRQDELLTIATRDQSLPDYALKLLSANVRPYPDNPELDISQLFRVYTVPAATPGGRPIRVAVTAVLGESKSAGIGSDQFLKIVPPAQALAEVLPRMQAERPDLLVLLSHAKTEESEKLAQQFPAFRLVVSLGGPEDGQLKPKPIGNSWLIQPGQKGKHVAVVGFYPGQATAFRYELVKLNGERFSNDPRLEELMQQYQDRLRNERPDLADNANAPSHPSGRTFVGAEACRECHAGSYEKWSSTGHAHAFESLSSGRADHKGRWIDRKWDAECIACHTVGWEPQQALRWASGYVDEATTPHLLGNQCENCHGPASRHVELEQAANASEQDRTAAQAEVRVTLEAAKTRICRQCHDGDNDPHFDFDKYWPEIEHHD